jgi:hypothetical protein
MWTANKVVDNALTQMTGCRKKASGSFGRR